MMQFVPSPAAADTASAADTVRTTPADVLAAAEAAGATLISTDFWFGLGQRAVTAGVIVALALLAISIITRIKRRWVASVQDDPATDKRRQRVLTVSDLLGSVARYAVWTVAGVMVLDTVGLPIGPLLAGAGIAGLAIGFGAQTFVKDVISGFFLLFDDTLGNGDRIRIGTEIGTVEYVGLRLIKVRKFNGELLMIPAGELRTFGNHSIGFARLIVPVGLSYEANLDVTLRALEDVAAEWASTEAAQAILLEDAPLVQGLTELGESAVTARIIAQVRPGEQDAAERALRALIKRRFDERGIEIPFPRRTVYVKTEGSGDLPDGAAHAAGAAD